MGLLNYLYAQQGMPQFAQPQQPTMQTVQPAQFAPLTQLAPDKPMTPEASPGGFWGRAQKGFDMQGLNKGFEGAFNSPLFTLGMSLMGNAQGSRWDQVGADMRQYGQDQTARQRAANEERRLKSQEGRDESVWGRQQTEWGQQDQQRRHWEEALARETDPRRQAQLRAIGPQGYGDFIAQERQMEFQAQEGRLNREADARAAAIRAANENPLGRMFQSMDAQQLGAMNQRASVLQAQTLPALRQVRENILQAGTSATGQPVDYNTRIAINRVFNGQGADRQALETWRARILRPALEMLPPGPATDRDVALVMENFANPNMQVGSALSLIDERIAAAEREVVQAQAANDFFGQANGLTGTRNQTGQDWPSYLTERLSNAPGMATTPESAIPQGGYRAPPPPVGTVRDGYRFRGGDPGDPANWQRVEQGARRLNNGVIR